MYIHSWRRAGVMSDVKRRSTYCSSRLDDLFHHTQAYTTCTNGKVLLVCKLRLDHVNVHCMRLSQYAIKGQRPKKTIKRQVLNDTWLIEDF